MFQNFSPSSSLPRLLLLMAIVGGALLSPGGLIAKTNSIQATGAWISSSAMHIARNAHTSTRLSDGRVLVAGGRNITGQELNSAEIYDPATDRWTPTGNLNQARSNHIAVLLKDGRVLIVGKQSAETFNPATGEWSLTAETTLKTSGSPGTYDSSSATLLADGRVLVAGGRSGLLSFARSSAELFDPVAGTWSATGSLNFARLEHSATLLPDGRVLIAGGNNRLDRPTTVELFDPSTGRWTLTGSLRVPRNGHIAALLPNGRVLVAGGFSDDTGRTAEIYDPATGTWSPTGSLNFSHPPLPITAVQLSNGVVLFADAHSEVFDFASGRWSVVANPLLVRPAAITAIPDGKALMTGGNNDENALRNAELFDPSASLTLGAWSVTASPGGGQGHTATALNDGRVLISGGAIPSGGTAVTVSASAQVFDSEKGWQTVANMNTARHRHTATLLPNGQVLVVGGESNANSSLLSAELFNPATNNWRNAAPMSLPRRLHQAVLLPNGKVLVAGGANENNDLNGAELYDSTTDRWATTGSMAVARRFHSLTLLADGKVLVAGGETNGTATLSAELFDPATGMWKATGALKTARRRHTATRLPNGNVLVAGGDNNGLLDSAEIYDPATGQWTLTSALGFARQNQTATLLADGRILIAGGAGNDGRLNSAEVFDPTSNRFIGTGWLNVRRELHSATKLPDGRVLVVGGINGILSGGTLSNQQVRESEIYDPAMKLLPAPPARIAPVSASSFQSGDLAGESIIAIFGEGFTSATAAATTTPLPLTLGGVRVSILQQGGSFPVPLFFVSPNQINCQLFNAVTQAAPRGAITLSVTTSDGRTISEPVYAAPVIPSLFSADATGKGLAAAVALRIKANGEQVYEPVTRFDPTQNRIVAVPIDLSNANEQVFLILYGTGWRNRSSLSAVSATIGGAAPEIIFAGAQGDYVGLDQVNLRLPRVLEGRGEVEVRLTVDGIAANAVTVVIK